jgi:hypothetical protein
MKVYVVLNQALYADSSYYDCLGVFKTKDEAITAIGCMSYDIFQNKQLGETAEVIEDTDNLYKIENKEGYFEQFEIEEFEL